ncbi:hypothetical protein QJQ45_002730 [Haematococcus lacustris]|nr:hypothetical protein QJQ45_002730 [Haematococcus lacustris]
MSLVAQCLRGSGPVPRSKSRIRLEARENKSGELRAAHIAAVHASAGPSTPPGKQREERRAEWKTQRRQTERAADSTQASKGKGKAQGKAAKAKPAPQPEGLNMQRSEESKWRPLELCFWLDQGALPAKGKEYPGLGYKRLRDKPPKAQQQQPAEAQ